jgi:hypothetical protein
MLFIITGCRTTALIHKNDGTVIEGKIRRSNGSTVFVVPSVPSEKGNIALAQIPERADAIIVPEILEECIADHKSKCKRECVDRYPIRYTKAQATDCMKACPAVDSAKSLCEEVSIELPFARADIREIDHPGNIETCVGWPLGVLGIAMTVTGLYSVAHIEGASYYAIPLFLVGAIVTIPGFLVAIRGTVLYSRSKSAAKPHDTLKRTNITPVALSDGERTYWGLGMSWRW